MLPNTSFSKGADIYVENKQGESAIFPAIRGGLLPMVQYLIEKKNVDKDICRGEKSTPIMMACFNNQPQIAEYLISIGADINKKDVDGSSTIHYASFSGILKIVQKCIEEQNNDIDSKDNFGRTPLFSACSSGHFSVVNYLISKGANIKLIDDQGNTPLYYACRGGNLRIVELLISKGADIYQTNKSRRSPWEIAAENGHLQIIRTLIEKYNLDKNARGFYGLTPLLLATVSKRFNVIKYLIGIGADVNAYDDGGNTSLHYAAYNNDCKIISFLISNGANVNFPNKKGRTPLQTSIIGF